MLGTFVELMTGIYLMIPYLLASKCASMTGNRNRYGKLKTSKRSQKAKIHELAYSQILNQ